MGPWYIMLYTSEYISMETWTLNIKFNDKLHFFPLVTLLTHILIAPVVTNPTETQNSIDVLHDL